MMTYQDVIATYGQAFANRAMSYGWHHTDQNGEPFWTEERFEDILGLIKREDVSKTK